MKFQCFVFAVWGPPLTAEDFQNGAKLNDVSITEETRKAIRTGIESETYNKGGILYGREVSSCLVKIISAPSPKQGILIDLHADATCFIPCKPKVPGKRACVK